MKKLIALSNNSEDISGLAKKIPSIKQEKIQINSVQKAKALYRLSLKGADYFFDTIKELIETQQTQFEGFPSPIKNYLTALHTLRWMTSDLSSSELETINRSIDMQLNKAIIPQLVGLLQNTAGNADSWSLQAVQLICPQVTPTPFIIEESPYIRLTISRSKIHWSVQQYTQVLHQGSYRQPVFLQKDSSTVDLSIKQFLIFKQSGKRTQSTKQLSVLDMDTNLTQWFSRERPNRSSRNENKGVLNSTRLFDVDTYGDLKAHRPDGVLHEYDLIACFQKSKNLSTVFTNKHYDAVQSLSNYVFLCLQNGVIDSEKKVIFEFSDSAALSQWLYPLLTQINQNVQVIKSTKGVSKPSWILNTLWGPEKIATLKEVLADLICQNSKYLSYNQFVNSFFQTLVEVKRNHEIGSGTYIEYDHIPQKEAVIKVARQAGGHVNTKTLSEDSLAIAVPTWIHHTGETNGKRTGMDLPLSNLLHRDIESEWASWTQPGKYQKNKLELKKDDFEVLGAYRYLAKRFIKVYGLHQTIFGPWEHGIGLTDTFFLKELRELSSKGQSTTL